MTTRRLLGAVAASLSLSLGVLALVLGVADLAGVSANVWMRGWEKQGYVSDPAQWEDAYSRLSLARRMNPLSADHSADLGRLLDWKSLRKSPGSAAFTAFRQRAGRFHGEALGKRPNWGFAWAHYAENQLLLGNRGGDFLLALEKAITLAPWEPGVQVKIAWIGMASWDDLPTRMRILVQESIFRTVQGGDNFTDTVRLAAQYDWLEHLEPMIHTDTQLAMFKHVLHEVEHR